MKNLIHTLFFFLMLTQISVGQWYQQNSGTTNRLYDVSFIDADNGWAVGDSGIIINTTNGGATWSAQSSGFGDKLYGVSFTDVNNGTAVGRGIILKTTNGGINWITIISGWAEYFYDVDFIDSNNGMVVGYYPGGVILWTTDGWTTFSSYDGGTVNALNGVSGTDINNWTVVGDWGTILRTTNGGIDWISQASGTVNHLNEVSFTDANNGTAVGNNIILRTTNGGLDWIMQSYIYGGNSVSFTDANNGTAVGPSGTILRTTNGGTDWTLQISGTTNPLYGVSFTGANNGWAVGLGGTILNTTNGGMILTPPPPELFSPTNGSVNVNLPLTLIWNASEGATSYTLQVSTSDAFSTFIYNQSGLTDTSQVVTGLSNSTTYYWRVSASNNQGTSDWSIVWIFTTAVLFDNGTIIAWGENTDGQLIVPEPNENFVDVAAGGNHSVGLKSDGTIVVWGNEDWNYLYGHLNIPTPNSDFVSIAGGGAVYSLGLKSNGTIVAWGNNISGQCNVPSPNENFVAIAAGYNHSQGLKSNGTIVAWGENSFGQCNVPLPNDDFVAVTSGHAHSLGLKSDGTIVAWGNNDFEQLNVPSPNADFMAISANGSHSLGLKSNGTIVAWGYNSSGQCNVPLPNEDFVAIAVGWYHSLGLKSDGTIVAWGLANYGQIYVPAPNENFIAIAGGGYYSLGIKKPLTFQLTVDVNDGWNMVSAPGEHPTNQNVDTWWPDLTGTVWGFNGIQYVTQSIVTTGVGYWMNNTVEETYDYPAIGIVPHDPIPVTAGWNMMGGYETSPTIAALKAANPQITGTVWGFNGVQYQAATNLVPGYGYWLYVTTAGDITIPDALTKGGGEVVKLFKEDWGRIILTDASGKSYTLYAVKGEVDLDQYAMPPLPPAGTFDIRFGSGRIAEDLNSSMQMIDMNGITYPLKVKVEGMDIRLQDETSKTINVNLKSGEDVVINDATVQKLMVTGKVIPTVYALEQNYPNPFNPITKIKYSVPQASKVMIKVFDILGNEIETLVNEEKPVGTYEINWNAGNLSSGIYFYHLKAGSFIETKKMLLLK